MCQCPVCKNKEEYVDYVSLSGILMEPTELEKLQLAAEEALQLLSHDPMLELRPFKARQILSAALRK
jgi:hypothetical protein